MIFSREISIDGKRFEINMFFAIEEYSGQEILGLFKTVLPVSNGIVTGVGSKEGEVVFVLTHIVDVNDEQKDKILLDIGLPYFTHVFKKYVMDVKSTHSDAFKFMNRISDFKMDLNKLVQDIDEYILGIHVSAQLKTKILQLDKKHFSLN